MNDYTRHAHTRTIWAELHRVLLQRFVSVAGSPPKETLICEEVFFADKEVSQEALLEVMEEIQQREAEERMHMTQYEFRRRDGKVKSAAAAEEDHDEARGKDERRPSAKPTGGASPAKPGS